MDVKQCAAEWLKNLRREQARFTHEQDFGASTLQIAEVMFGLTDNDYEKMFDLIDTAGVVGEVEKEISIIMHFLSETYFFEE